MGKNNHPVSLRSWRKFLTSLGYEFSGIKGDHEKWSKPNTFRPIIFPIKDKEIQPFHIRTNLSSIGYDEKKFWQDIDKF